MPLFQVNYQDARRSPAMAAPQAYQQTDAILQEMEQRSQMMDLRERDMELSQMRALEFQQRQQQAAALDQQEFDAAQRWNAVKSQQAYQGALQEQGHLTQFWNPDTTQALQGMDASEPGFWDLYNQGTLEAQQNYQRAQLRGLSEEAKALGVDEQAMGYLEAGDIEGAQAVVKEARQGAIRKGAMTNWVASVATPYKAALDDGIRTGSIPPDKALEAQIALAQLQQLGTQDIREETPGMVESLRETLAMATADPVVVEQMQRLQQENEMLMARIAQGAAPAAGGQPPAPRDVPGATTWDARTDEVGQQTIDEQQRNQWLHDELERRKKAGLENKPFEVAPEIQKEVDSGKIKWRGSRNLQ